VARKRRRAPAKRRTATFFRRTSAVGAAVQAGIALAACLGLAALWTGWALLGPGPHGGSGGLVDVVLPRGAGVGDIAETLKAAEVIRSESVFIAVARATGTAGGLKAGEYEFRQGMPMARVLADIRAGKVVRRMITIPEGWTSAMAADAVARSAVLKGDFTTPAEGALLPETYRVERGQQRQAVLDRMAAAQDRLLAELWPARQQGLPFKTAREAVTLASIVEKETGVAAERPRIAAVFINRLRAGMRLESDPTIIYGITQGRPLGRRILASEIAAKTAYNTYQIDGLPPTPIANPGRAAIAAVLNPPKSSELFFVADGSGGHVFASDFETHKANVARWRAYQRSEGAR
jgi:UPF0755 protein